jgi:hypothetical protein
MVFPNINALPVAPTRADAQPDYSAKADTFTAALPQFSIQVNTAVSWMGDTMAATLDYKNAAAASANLASLAAQTAATQAALAASGGAAQVSLAATQAQNAAQSATNAQTYAAAAQAAAGTPSLVGHDAFDVLQINSAKNGVQWGKAGQSVGDILVSAKVPDGTYASTNRVTYLKSAYPDLAALLGALPDADRSIVSVASINPSFPSETSSYTEVAQTDNSSLIVALLNSSPWPCVTSADKGLTWTRRLTGFPVAPFALAQTNGIFVATFQNQAIVSTSTDGVSWTSRNIPASIAAPGIFASNGIFILFQIGGTNGVYYTSVDGVTWATRSGFAANGTNEIAKINNYFVTFASGSNVNYWSADNGLTWTSVNAGVPFNSIAYYNGTYYAVYNGDTSKIWTSTTPLVSSSWKITNTSPNAGSTYGLAAAATIGQCIIFPANPGATISNDGGSTWSYRDSTTVVFNRSLSVGNKLFYVQGNNGYSLPVFSYDIGTSFITPKANVQPAPLVTYIKGKLA